ncbi:Gas vesicle synthesis protein GvpL/GvpF [Streptomyces sp. S4.7]|uniref:GvpL/GvpF family gas vesicle protein n=1 Tax=Streptomyces sp. S4.7 TaxID=2705439 RepID=UPI00139721A8|nr:GvpL/GvpF family gas vesicle protein [Streptomyces sp. S4.7]QHY99777.1 Gas vesicle synthesis protein GvpL/GvpF [Streptomyces sp. S4.7]
MNSTDVRAVAPPMSYVYAVGRAGESLDSALSGRTGAHGGALRTVRAGDLVALVSSVPHDAFGTEGLRAQMEDIKQLEVLARAHHCVVEAAYESATVLPMRLATVYLDDARVTEMLVERAVEFGDLLSRLEGHVELGVKVYADPREAAAVSEAARTATGPGDAAVTSPGRAYLRQRREQRRNHRDAYQAAGAVAAEVPVRVGATVRARLAHRPQQGDLAPGAGENIANEAYLVEASRVAEFHAALAGLADGVPGVRVEITGPWAPYSFATPPAEGTGARSGGEDGGRR